MPTSVKIVLGLVFWLLLMAVGGLVAWYFNRLVERVFVGRWRDRDRQSGRRDNGSGGSDHGGGCGGGGCGGGCGGGGD